MISLSKLHLPLLLSLLLFSLLPSSIQQPPPLPAPVKALMATRAMRYHHFLFHNVRNNWNSLDNATQAQIASYGWKPPRPAKSSSGQPLKDNNSGEDFLYAHFSMINMVNRLLKQNGAPSVTGFKVIPAANDTTFPMPKNFTAPNEQLTKLVNYYKSEEYYKKLKYQEGLLTNATFLKTMTLGQLGAYIEWMSDVHQGMHFRFGAQSNLMRVKTKDPIPFVDPKWDVVDDDWLIDVYASHVNPWFWKLHGWINDRIFDWAKANGLSKIKFKGTWTGGNLNTLPKADNVTDNAQVRFLGDKPEKKTEDMNMNNEEKEVEVDVGMENMDMDMDMDHMGMDMSGNGKESHPDLDPATGMNITAMEAVVRILMDKGVDCNYFSDMGNGNEGEQNDMNGWN